jgi:hypothetical protein
VHVEADVPLVGQLGLTRVQPHTHLDGAGGQRLLALARGSDRSPRGGERVEEGVALRIHLHAAVAGEGLAQHTTMLGERFGVSGAQLVQQARRPLDVGEEEGDRPMGEIAPHRPDHATRRPPVSGD